MEARSKVCWTGAGLFVAGTALAIFGAALLGASGVSWATEKLRKSGPKHLDRAIEGLGTAGTSLGSVAGRMQHHVTRAARVVRKAGEGAIKGFNEAVAKG